MGDTIAQRAGRIHHSAVVIDTHSDTTPNFENPEWDFSQRHSEGHIDIPRLRDGGYDAVFWAIYMGKTPGDGKAIKTALRRIDSVHEIVRHVPFQYRPHAVLLFFAASSFAWSALSAALAWARVRSTRGSQALKAFVRFGKHPASPAPKRKRMTSSEP